jgi:hypothetical protein
MLNVFIFIVGVFAGLYISRVENKLKKRKQKRAYKDIKKTGL